MAISIIKALSHWKSSNLILAMLVFASSLTSAAPIDRHALVTRHNVILSAVDLNSPLSVGNGEFAFTADVTGLQTFQEEYNKGIPLSTMSQLGFHTMPSPEGFTIDKFPLTLINTNGRSVGYVYFENGKSPAEWRPAADYLYANPGRLNLGRLALNLIASDGRRAQIADLKDIHQVLDLWSGEIKSHFVFDGESVDVSTSCHPNRELVSVDIRSKLINKGRLSVELSFPYGVTAFNGNGGNWGRPEAHETIMTQMGNQANFIRTLDKDRYYASLAWGVGNRFTVDGTHNYRLSGDAVAGSLEFSAAYSQNTLPMHLPNTARTLKASAGAWRKYWTSGGAIDLSQSADPRWKELERRIVLSQYLTRIQCCGSLPPQETGLTSNSWFGKFHLEMHWWHAAHFPLWGRSELLERSLPFYQRILPKAQATAKLQGYDGARWPKCVGPSGDPGPTYLECFLIWQQPHPISFAELCYRNSPSKKTLLKYKSLVFETAKFMASYASWDEKRNQYRIGPPFSDAAEVYFADHEHQWNPTFEIAQWRSGLETAQRWRERLGLSREKKWDDVISHLPPMTIRGGLYVAGETSSDTFAKTGRNTSHPTMLGPLGMLNDKMVDRETMRRTLHKILDGWDWENTWGWDYPLMAMTAARLGEGDTAINCLLMDKHKNYYLPNGHNPQLGPTLPLYLPGNGGLLYAVAIMAAGWDGGPTTNAPGFPRNGKWVVRVEGLRKAP